MSQLNVPSETASPVAVASSGKNKKKNNKQRTDARAKFDASAPSMSVERFFNGYNETKRNNVDVVLDPTLQDRLAQFYVSKAHTYAMSQLDLPVVRARDLCAKTHALVSLTLARKLLLSVPQSEDIEMARFKFIREVELMAPKSLISVVDNVGKFEEDKFRGRLKYGNLDLFRIIVHTCKVMNNHSDYNNRYYTPYNGIGDNRPWPEVNEDELVNVSESAVRWIRDKAVEFLNNAYQTTWEVILPQPPPGDGQPPPPEIRMNVTYPHLRVSDNYQAQVANVAAWLALLNDNMPNVDVMIAAGLSTIWKLMWLQRPADPFNLMGERFPDWINLLTPRQVLNTLGLVLVETGIFDDADQTWISMIKEIHREVSSDQALFSRFLDLAKQPDVKFGSVAMMYPYNREDLLVRPMIGLPYNYSQVRQGAQSRVVIPWTNTGSVVAGLVGGFTSSVSLTPSFLAQLNGSPDNLLTQVLKPDVRFANF